MKKIDELSCHPKNIPIIYHRYALSKLSWHLTIADLSKNWVIQNLDNIVARKVKDIANFGLIFPHRLPTQLAVVTIES